MRVRKAEARDEAAWARMRIALWPGEDAEELRTECAGYFQAPPANAPVFIAEDANGAAVGMLEAGLRGFAEGCRTSPVAYIEAWYVAAEARKSGVGRALILAAADWGRARGCSEIASDTMIDNEESQSAHSGVGFEEVGRVVCYRASLVRP